jgi:hypothetical protein
MMNLRIYFEMMGLFATAGPIDTLKEVPVEKEGVTMKS